MNYLALCQDVARETGTVSGGVGSIATVEGGMLSARVDKVASWVAKAWRSIQTSRSSWLWMQREFTAAMTIGQPRYTGPALGQARVAKWANDALYDSPWSVWDADLGVSDESEVREIDYEIWRARWQRGSNDPGRPTEYALAPSGEIVFGPTPDKAYMVRGIYRLTPQQLVNDDDVPEMPEEFHDLIVWDAARLLSNSDEAPVSAASANMEVAVLRSRLERDQLPRIQVGTGPLA